MGKNILHTPLCDLLGIQYPIMLAGMASAGDDPGRCTPPKLVAEVSNAGGIGVAGCTEMHPHEMRQRIREIRQLTDKPFGIDLMLPASMAEVEEESLEEIMARIQRESPRHVAFIQDLIGQFGLEQVKVHKNPWTQKHIRECVEVCLEEKVPLFVAATGDPAWMVPLAHAQGMKVMGLVGSPRHALRQLRAGVDIIGAQGYEAGGHTGKIGTLTLVPQIVDLAKPTPVVAAGGIADGRGLLATLALGAVGVWCGTAFLVAEESEIHPIHQEQILQATSEDVVVTRYWTGKPCRTFKSPVVDAWDRSGLDALPFPLQMMLGSEFSVAAEAAKKYEFTENDAGQIAGLLKEKKPGARILKDMVEEAISIFESFQREQTIVRGS